jgi:hypothetical protein
MTCAWHKRFRFLPTGDAAMDRKRIAVVYDTSYLAGDFQSVKQFILSRSYSCPEEQGLLGSLVAKITGKSAQEKMVDHGGDRLFSVNEVVPAQVILEVTKLVGEKEHPAVTSLLSSGAVRVDFDQDTIVGDRPAPSLSKVELDLAMANETDEQLLGYAERLIEGGNERYDLAIVATEDKALLERIDQLAKAGKSILSVKNHELTQTGLLVDKLSALANARRR